MRDRHAASRPTTAAFGIEAAVSIIKGLSPDMVRREV